jgi:hypothetical protein
VYDKAHPLLTLTPAVRLEVVTIADRAPGSQGSPSARPTPAHASIERSVPVPCNAHASAIAGRQPPWSDR